MAGVFISHAAVDKPFVDHFVDDILRLGCGLGPTDLFYSSGSDTGVPSGLDLMAHVRAQVADAVLVIAVISPTYQARPVCIAELGAAWGVTGKLFPLLVPGMDRGALEGVVSPQATRYIDDKYALDELRDLIGEVLQRPISAKTWGQYKEKWLVSVARHAASIPPSQAVTLAEFERVQGALDSTKLALAEAETTVDELRSQIEELARVRPQEKVAAIRLPRKEEARFKALVKLAADALNELSWAVAEAVRFDAALGQPMPWPNAFEEPDDFQLVRKAVEDGELLENSDEDVVPDYEFPTAHRAKEAVHRLAKFLREESSSEFIEWYEQTYQLPMNLRKKQVWQALLGSMPLS